MRTVVAAVLLTGCWSAITKEPATPAAPLPAPEHHETALRGSAIASLAPTGDVSSGSTTPTWPADRSGTDLDANRAGSGTSAGGTGWGTIGTGKYGRIPHGSGDGYAIHGGRRGTPIYTVPIVSLGQPNATPADGLDKQIIRRSIHQNIQKIQYCYELVLVDKPTLAGTLTTKFMININGSVILSSASGIDPKLETCVAQVIRTIEFPKPKDGKTIDVVYPLVWRWAGS